MLTASRNQKPSVHKEPRQTGPNGIKATDSGKAMDATWEHKQPLKQNPSITTSVKCFWRFLVHYSRCRRGWPVCDHSCRPATFSTENQPEISQNEWEITKMAEN